MAASGFTVFTQKEVDSYKDCELSDQQIQKLDAKEKAKIDKNVKRYTYINDAAGQDKTKNARKPENLRLVLLGKTGAGKSATGNLILGGAEIFKESDSSESCTKTNNRMTAKVDGITISLIDTPGICDTKLGDDVIITEIARIFNDFCDGIHAFIFIINLGNPRFTSEQRKAFQTMNETFGGNQFLDHCFMVLTNGDSLEENMTLEEKLQSEKGNPFGQLIIEDLKKKVIIVDNRTDKPYLKDQLQKRILNLVAKEAKEPFTNDSIQQYLNHTKKTQQALPAEDQFHAPDIERAVADSLKKLGRKDIKKLKLNRAPDGKITTDRVTQQIAVKILDDLKKEGITVQMESILLVAKAQQERLTDDSFLDKIRAVWGKFLSIFRGE